MLDLGVAAAGLYRLAIDLLVDIHSRNPVQIIPQGIATYDDDLFMTEVGLFLDWYLPAVLPDGLTVDAAQEFRSIWLRLLPGARNVPDTLVLRDFHVDNLIRLEGREGVAACGLLDFQDAVKGPVTYDVISLLEDARRDVPDDLAARMRERYLSNFPNKIPPNSNVPAPSWARSGIVKCSAFSRGFAIATARTGICDTYRGCGGC